MASQNTIHRNKVKAIKTAMYDWYETRPEAWQKKKELINVYKEKEDEMVATNEQIRQQLESERRMVDGLRSMISGYAAMLNAKDLYIKALEEDRQKLMETMK